jgi:hypothetical protein
MLYRHFPELRDLPHAEQDRVIALAWKLANLKWFQFVLRCALLPCAIMIPIGCGLLVFLPFPAPKIPISHMIPVDPAIDWDLLISMLFRIAVVSSLSLAVVSYEVIRFMREQIRMVCASESSYQLRPTGVARRGP